MAASGSGPCRRSPPHPLPIPFALRAGFSGFDGLRDLFEGFRTRRGTVGREAMEGDDVLFLPPPASGMAGIEQNGDVAGVGGGPGPAPGANTRVRGQAHEVQPLLARAAGTRDGKKSEIIGR